MCAARAGGELDPQEGTLLGVRLGDVHHEEIGEQEFGQRVGAIVICRPVHLPVEAVPEGKVGVQPGTVCAQVGLREMEGVLGVVQVTDLQVAVDLVELLRRQHQVFDLRSAGALEPDVELAPGQGFRDHPDQRRAAEHRAVELDDQAEDVLAVEVNRTRVGEGELAR